MEDLLKLLYIKHISSKDLNMDCLCQLQPLKIFNLTQEQLQFYSSMLARNFITYSATNMQLKLSTKHLLGMHRLHKFQMIMKQNGVESYFQQWIDNQLMPFVNEGNKLPANCPYVYIDSKQEQQKQAAGHENVVQPPTKSKKKDKSTTKTKQNPHVKHKRILNINIIQLSTQLQNRVLIKELQIKKNQLSENEKRKQLIQKYRKIKIQQYINQRFNMQTLMVFNYIQQNPYVDQKYLLNKTMLSSAQLRRCIAQLLTEGFLTFYPENSRTMMFKVLPFSRMKQIYRDHICQSIINLYIFLQTNITNLKNNEKRITVLKSLEQLDDILMMFLA